MDLQPAADPYNVVCNSVLARLRSFISSVMLPSWRGDCGVDRSGDPLSNLGLIQSLPMSSDFQ